MYFEDFTIGLIIKTKPKKITKSEIIDFAKNYDPQRFHIDDEKAKKGPFGRLVSRVMTQENLYPIFETGVIDETGMGAWGIDELRWIKPVYPDDTIITIAKVLDKKISSKNPNKGTVRTLQTVINQKDEIVMTWISNFMIKSKNSI